jgi:putative selenate reductase molybdopterin-binding subunit
VGHEGSWLSHGVEQPNSSSAHHILRAYALTEELVWDDDGKLVNPSLAEYAVQGAKDTPVAIEAIVIENPESTGPFGAMGIGEPALAGVAAAVGNGIAQPFGGACPHRLPMTPERVLAAIEQASARRTPGARRA